MNTKIILGIVVILAIAGIGIFVLRGSHGLQGSLLTGQTNSSSPASAQPSSSNALTASNSQSAINSSKVLFSSTPYASYAYQISPGSISPQAQSALAGFNISSSMLQNGSSKISLTILSTGQTQTAVLAPNYKLYLIETTFADDGYHFDSSLGDDGFVVVNATGYIM